MRIEETVADQASQAGPRNRRVRVSERVSSDMFFSTLASAAQAAKLSVEGIQALTLRAEFVLVPLQQLLQEFLVHLLEQRHDALVAEGGL